MHEANSGNDVRLISSFQTQQTTEMICEEMLLKMQWKFNFYGIQMHQKGLVITAMWHLTLPDYQCL